MLKFQDAAEIGDTIRAYDRKPMIKIGDSYVEGVVVDISSEMGYLAFVIKCNRDVRRGTLFPERVGQLVFVPMELTFLEFDCRIINLSRIF